MEEQLPLWEKKGTCIYFIPLPQESNFPLLDIFFSEIICLVIFMTYKGLMQTVKRNNSTRTLPLSTFHHKLLFASTKLNFS